MRTALAYYLWGNFAPDNKWNNVLPSLCSVRTFNKNIPIILYCEDGSDCHSLREYQEKLDFDFAWFPNRRSYNPLCYRPYDVFNLLIAKQLDYIFSVDSDVIWHRDPGEALLYCIENDKNNYGVYINSNMNGGLFGFAENVSREFIGLWYALGRWLDGDNQGHLAKFLVRKHYKKDFVHDESALAILYSMYKNIYIFPSTLAYTPRPDDLEPPISEAYSIHYTREELALYVSREGNVDNYNSYGRIGYLLSIKEYAAAVSQLIGPLPLRAYPVRKSSTDFLQDWKKIILQEVIV